MALDQARGGGAAEVGRLLGEKAVEPRRSRGRRQPAEGRRRTYAPIIRTTPTETAESATLNTGQK